MFNTFRTNPTVETATVIVETRRSNPFALLMVGADNQALANALDLLADGLDWRVSGLTDADAALIQGMIDAAIEAAKPAPKAAPTPVAAPVAVATPAPEVSVADLPALTGSDKQVAWASDLRLKVADVLAGKPGNGLALRAWAKLARRADAKFWIDNFRAPGDRQPHVICMIADRA